MRIRTVNLIATKVKFTKFSIIYDVACKEVKDGSFLVHCPFDISSKDLILKPTVIQKGQMKVVYTPSNVTSEFYEKIFNETISNHEEYYVEKKYIYDVGDVVGIIIVTDL